MERRFQRVDTSSGKRAPIYANTTVADLGESLSGPDTLRAGGHGHLTAGAISASAAQIVIIGIHDILREHPRLVVKLVKLSSDRLAVSLEAKKWTPRSAA